MDIKVTMDNTKLRRLERAAVLALEKTAESVKTEVINAQVMPFAETTYNSNGQVSHSGGTMQNQSTSIDTSNSNRGEVTINVDTPYARRVYFHPEFNFNKSENPNARGEWFEPWIDGEKKDFAQKAFNKLYKREAGL